MPTPSDAVRSAPGPPTALPATRPSRHQPRLQARQKTEVVVAATVAAILLLLLAFVLWPVLRVLATSLAGPAGLTLDRKSTRLNSSHLVISYAVFCLKKKKKNKLLCIVCDTGCHDT